MSIPSAIFTIVSANYIAFAATLMQSVRRFHPDVPRFIILSDGNYSPPAIASAVTYRAPATFF
jgi:hypothetical protein